MSQSRVRVTAQGSCNLSFRSQDHEFYIGYEDPDGTIHLVPAVLVPAVLLKEPEAGLKVLERTAEMPWTPPEEQR